MESAALFADGLRRSYTTRRLDLKLALSLFRQYLGMSPAAAKLKMAKKRFVTVKFLLSSLIVAAGPDFHLFLVSPNPHMPYLSSKEVLR